MAIPKAQHSLGLFVCAAEKFQSTMDLGWLFCRTVTPGFAMGSKLVDDKSTEGSV